MPLLLLLIVLIAFAGGVQQSGKEKVDVKESDVIVSGPTGGLVRVGSVAPAPIETPTVSQPVTPEEPAPIEKIPPTLSTLSPQNIETSRALMRGEIVFSGERYNVKTYFIYSRDAAAVTSLSDTANKVLVSNYAPRGDIFTRNLSGLSDGTTYYYRACYEESELVCGNVVSFDTVEDVNRNDVFRAPSVTTNRAVDIEAENVTLEGSYRRNDAANATAFFVYGEDQTAIREVPDKYDEYSDVRELDEDLQKVRVGVNIADRGEYSRIIDELERDTTYYHRLCVAYDDDEETGIKCGSTLSFETKRRQRDDPTARSLTADVSGTTVEMSAFVSMEDYLDGHVFIVYGTSEDRITAVENADRFSRVQQSGDTIQKISLDVDFDGSDTLSATARDLTAANYFYRYCVEYEKENDRGTDVLHLTCSTVESFDIE